MEENLENKNPENCIEEVAKTDKSEKTVKEGWTFRKVIRLFVLVIAIIIFWISIVQYAVADKYIATVQVKDENSATGVNPTSEKLDYGDIPKGGSMIRSITVSNSGNIDVYIKIFKYGEISELIKEEKGGFTLLPGNEDNIEFTINVPISAEEREYKGGVLIFKFPKIF